MTALRQLIMTETKLFLRDPIAVAYGLLFPTVLLLGLGSIPILRHPSPEFAGVRFVDHWAPSALVIGMIAIGVQHVPIVVATYRERGILRRLGTTPVHPSMLLVTQLIVAFVFVVLSAVILIVAAWLVLDVSLPQQPVTFMLAFVLGFAALVGVAMVSAATTPTAQSANGISMVLFLVTMFFGGVFLPRFMLPDIVMTIGDFVPPGVQNLLASWDPAAAAHTVELGWPMWAQLTVMAAIALVASAVAAKLFRWD